MDRSCFVGPAAPARLFLVAVIVGLGAAVSASPDARGEGHHRRERYVLVPAERSYSYIERSYAPVERTTTRVIERRYVAAEAAGDDAADRSADSGDSDFKFTEDGLEYRGTGEAAKGEPAAKQAPATRFVEPSRTTERYTTREVPVERVVVREVPVERVVVREVPVERVVVREAPVQRYVVREAPVEKVYVVREKKHHLFGR